MPAGYDWVFWTVGGLLGALALWLLYWSLLHDRSRGRRRCPKCWYDMSGTPGSLTRSECGRVVKRERKLLKTRGRWRWALCAIGCLTAACGALSFRMLGDQWVTLVPTAYLIARMPTLPQSNPQLYSELESRMRAGKITRREWHWLYARTKANIKDAHQLSVDMREHWPAGAHMRCWITAVRKPSGQRWLDLQDVRVRVSPTVGADAEITRHLPGIFHRVYGCGFRTVQPFEDDSIAIGVARSEDSRIDFNVQTDFQATTPEGVFWIPLPTTQLQRNVKISPRNSDVIAPVQFELVLPTIPQPLLLATVTRRIYPVAHDASRALLHLTFRCTDPAGTCSLWGFDDKYAGSIRPILSSFVETTVTPTPRQTLAIGVVVELLSRDQVLATTNAWVRRVNEFANWRYALVGDRNAIEHAMLDPNELVVRIRGDLQVALRDREANQYWTGECMAPVAIVEQ